MSSEKEDEVLLKSPDGSETEPQKKSRLSYTRDFLLSLSELDVCKKLPHGFDASILSEFGDSGSTTFERQRNPGSFVPRRGDFGSVLQNRPDGASSYARGSQGRWDTRSSGSGDRDSDSQSDRESLPQDSGRRFGNQARRSWQNSEHDGLLGSGAFPRPTGLAGNTAPKGRGNGQYQLNRSTEPYHPPRPYKAVPYSRKDSTDSYNDETFGSTDCSSEDRAEEERKRRESFELMRKEQHKSLQEKQKPNPDNHKENHAVDIMAILAKSADANDTGQCKPEEPVAVSLSSNDSSIYSLHAQAPASRPLVPPGFRSALVDKNLPVQSSSTSITPEARRAVVENKHLTSTVGKNQDMGNSSDDVLPVSTGKYEPKGSSQFSTNANENLLVPILSANALRTTAGFESLTSKASGRKAHEVWEDDIVVMNDSSCKKDPIPEIENTVGQEPSTTILEKLFSSVLSRNNATSPKNIVVQDIKADEKMDGPEIFESSKFAGWFREEETKSEVDSSSKDLLSLLVSNENSGSPMPISSEKSGKHIPVNTAFETFVSSAKLVASPATSSVIGVPEKQSQGHKSIPSSVVLTCEDLEQSILAEVQHNSPKLKHSSQEGWSSFNENPVKPKVDVDNSASQHLLSLLQTGPSLKDPNLFQGQGMESTATFPSSHVKPNIIHTSDGDANDNPEVISNSEQTLTLETLFGASFMSALHSAEAPVSAQRVPDVSTNHSDVTSHESKSKQHTEGYGESPAEASSQHHLGILEDEAVDIQLPEEDSLFTVNDTVNGINPEHILAENKKPDNFNDKFRNPIFRDAERFRTDISDGVTQLQKGPVEMVDRHDLHHHGHGKPPSHFPHQMEYTRPMFPQIDHLASRNPHMKLAGPDGMRDPFPTNLSTHHAFNNMSAPRFDSTAAHHLMLQNVPGNFGPHHQMQSLPRGMLPSHLVNHMPGFMPEVNSIHNFPLHNQQHNYGGGLGMNFPGPVPGDGRIAHPDAIQRLFEMEMRANSKQMHPPAGVQIPGMYAPENMNFRYR